MKHLRTWYVVTDRGRARILQKREGQHAFDTGRADPAALLGRLADNARVALVSPGDATLIRRGDRPLGLHQDEARDAQFGPLLEYPLQLLAFQERHGQRQFAPRLGPGCGAGGLGQIDL